MAVFIKFEGGKTKVRGDVKKGVHKDWLTLDSAQFNWSRPPVSGLGGRGNESRENRSYSEVVCTTSAEEAASDIFVASAQGTAYKLVTIDFAKSSEDTPYLQVKLSEAMISSVNVSGGQNPATSFTFSYQKAEYAHNTPAEGKSATLMQFDVDTAKVR